MRHELANEYMNDQIDKFNNNAEKPLSYAVVISLAAGLIVNQVASQLGLDQEVSIKAGGATAISLLAVSGGIYEIARNINLLEISENMDLQRDQNF